MISLVRCLRHRKDDNIKMKIQITFCEYAHYLAIQVVRSAEKSNKYFCSMKTKMVLCLSNGYRLRE